MSDQNDKPSDADKDTNKKPARGVRFEPEEAAWLEWLEEKMFGSIPGARRSFSAAVREAITCGRWLIGDAADTTPPIDALRRLAARLNVTPQEALRRAISVCEGVAFSAPLDQPGSAAVDGGREPRPR